MKALLCGMLAGAASMVAGPAQACACGVALEASVSRERALLIEGDGRQEIIASFDLASSGAGRAAIVLPVPGDPEVEAVEGDPLTYLDIATRAPARDDELDTGAAGAGPPGVDVIGRDVIGGYDVTRLRAGDAGELDAWLDENGYTLPAGAEPILAEYVADGWRYVAIRLAAGASGALKPLRVGFDADAPVYPMKLSQLGTTALELTVYVLADGERAIDGLDVAWSGRVGELSPAPPVEVAEVLEAGTHVTKLTASRTFTTDLYVGGGAVAGPSEAPGWGAPLAIVLALAGAALLGLSRRT